MLCILDMLEITLWKLDKVDDLVKPSQPKSLDTVMETHDAHYSNKSWLGFDTVST